MKQVYSVLVAFLMLLCAQESSAQVSVTATAGTMGPTTYTTLREAFDSVNSGRHQGAIVITISANTTEVKTDSLGAGATFTSLLVKPAPGTTPIVTGAFTTQLVYLNRTKNVTIDGSNTVNGTTKNLTLVNTDPAGNGIKMINGASFNTIKNCVIKGASASSAVISFSTAGGSGVTSGNSHNLIQNNDITNSTTLPNYGIVNTGSNATLANKGNAILGNRIFNFRSAGFLDGNGTNGFSDSTLVEGNEIYEMVDTISTAVKGIRVNNATGVKNMVLSKNYIHDLKGLGAVYGIEVFNDSSLLIVNNMISLDNATATSLVGIRQGNGSLVTRTYHNTVYIAGVAAGVTAESYAFYKSYTSTKDTVLNNIFVNARTTVGTGKQYAIGLYDSIGTMVSNYNDLASTGGANSFIGVKKNATASTDYATLAAWTAATSDDANSVSIMPTFVSPLDLHIVNTSANAGLDNKGTPVGVTIDYDNQARSNSTPDLGADEFTITATSLAIVNQDVLSSKLSPSIVRSQTTLNVVSKTAMSIRWTVADASGKVVKTFVQQAVAGSNDLNLQMSNLSSGIYSITGVSSKGTIPAIRFVKQ